MIGVHIQHDRRGGIDRIDHGQRDIDLGAGMRFRQARGTRVGSAKQDSCRLDFRLPSRRDGGVPEAPYKEPPNKKGGRGALPSTTHTSHHTKIIAEERHAVQEYLWLPMD